MEFQTKAKTLESLSKSLTCAIVLPQVRIRWSSWKATRVDVLQQLRKDITERKLIVRSTSPNEDNAGASNAGHFESVGNVDATSVRAVCEAVDRVFASYGDDQALSEVFVQPHLQDIALSGVIFTQDLDTNSAYYVINYDDRAGAFDTVTSGTTDGLKTYIRYKDSPNPCHPLLEAAIEAAQELEMIFDRQNLDIEFAITSAGEVVIFQVRPLLKDDKSPLSRKLMEHYLLKIHSKLEKLNRPHPNLYGDKSIFGVMPDWNPAEIIGVRPRRLALSIYKELVTDNIWAYQRDNYGYKNLRSFPLLISFLGLPYIDVRVSFNSFIPEELDDALSHKLANHYLTQLANNRQNHDKVEFNIVFSCAYPDIDEAIGALSENGFSAEEIGKIKQALLRLTNNIIDPNNGLCKRDLDKVAQLDARRQKIVNSHMSINDKIYWLMEECKRYGTLPFSGLARGGFVAVQFLKSMIRMGLLTENDYHNFLGSLDSVTKQFSGDFEKMRENKLNREDFLTKYGHLRPGTYDILSKTYSEAFDSYFTNLEVSNPSESPPEQAFELSTEKRAAIDKALIAAGIQSTSTEIFAFCKQAIEGREYSKFEFTRCLSNILQLTEQFGGKYGFSREDMSFLDIDEVMKLYSNLEREDLPDLLRENIENNRQLYTITQLIRLPQLIVHPNEVYDFFLEDAAPNFITLNAVQGNVVLEENFEQDEMQGKIVFIASADPGYDWIFSRSIAGLVTMYGGANSHMAIRAAELGLPAIIGAGEKKFKEWSAARLLEIDCSNKTVKIIR